MVISNKMAGRVTSIITTDKAVATDEIRLSICLGANGFSFSAMTVGRELLTFGEAEIDLHRGMGELSQSITGLFTSAGIPTFGCKEVSLVVPTNHAVWVPEHLYDAGRDSQYLKMAASMDGSMGVFHAYCESMQSWVVFAAEAETVTAFKVAIPGVDVVCQHVVLVNETLIQRSAQHPVMLMHVRDGVGDYEAFYNQRILLSNSFMAGSDDELLYHALEVMKRLHLETPDMELAICGEVGREMYGMLQHYFPNVTLYTGIPFTYANPAFQTLHSYKHVMVL